VTTAAHRAVAAAPLLPLPDSAEAVRLVLCTCPDHGDDPAAWPCTIAATQVEGWLATMRRQRARAELSYALDAARARDSYVHRIVAQRADHVPGDPRTDDLEEWEREARARWVHQHPGLARLIETRLAR